MSETRDFKKKIQYLTRLAMLVAVMIVLDVVPFLGYIKIGPVEMTTMMIPVMIGAIVMGPGAGAILGLVFGITSLLQCVGIPSLSWFGSTLFNINAWSTSFMCIVPRVLMGFLCGLIFKALIKVDKTRVVSYAVASLSAAVTNTVLFVGCLVLFFNGQALTADGEVVMVINSSIGFLAGLVGVNGLVEAVVCTIIGAAIAKVLDRFVLKKEQN